MISKSKIRILAATTAALLALTGVAAGALTPAGTSITAGATASYSDSTGAAMPSVSSNQVAVSVGQIADLGIAAGANQTVTVGQTGGLAFSVANKGNGSDTIAIGASTTMTNVKVDIVKDANGDGLLQSTETTLATSTGALSAGASAKFIARVTTADNTLIGKSASVVIDAKSGFDSTKTATSDVSVAFASSDSKFVRGWLVNGYYANADKTTRLDQAYITTEALSAPRAGDVEGGKSWTLYTSPTDDLDFSKLFSTVTACAAYACVYVNSPVAGDALLKMGSDDGVKAWVNGQVVWNNNVFRDCIPDTDSAPVKLMQGWNRVLVKVSQDLEGWSTCLRVADTAGNPIPGLTYATDTGDTVAPVVSNVKVIAGATDATIDWDTDEPSSTEVGYGVSNITDGAYGDAAFATHHTAKITGLQPGTTYQYKVYSADVQNNIGSSAQLTFGTENNPTQTATYITSWVVNGVYANTDKATRLSKSYLPSETSIYPYTGYTSNSKAWIKATAPSTTGRVDLGALYNGVTNCAGYAHIYVYSATNQSLNLLLASDDGIKVWQNGRVIYTNDVYRGFTPDSDRVAVTLSAGWHRFLVKVSQGSGGWSFAARFVDASGNPAQGLTYNTEKPW